MKTIAKTLAILSVLLTGSLMLTGQKPFLIKDIQPLMAFVPDINDEVELSAVYNKVQLKNWMIDRNHWETAGSTRLAYALREEKEDRLVMEDWMVQLFAPGRDKLSELLKVEKEIPLQFHTWMICCADWKIVRL